MRLLCPRYYTHSTAVLQLKSNILPKSCQTSEEGIWQMCRYSKVHLLQRSAVHYISKVQHDRRSSTIQGCRNRGVGGARVPPSVLLPFSLPFINQGEDYATLLSAHLDFQTFWQHWRAFYRSIVSLLFNLNSSGNEVISVEIFTDVTLSSFQKIDKYV